MIPQEAFKHALEHESGIWRKEYTNGQSDYALGRVHAYDDIKAIAKRLANGSPTSRWQEVAQFLGAAALLHKALRSVLRYLQTGDRKKALRLLVNTETILLSRKRKTLKS